jgi:hypothetical protein
MDVAGDAEILYPRDQMTACWLNCSWHGLVNVRLPLNSQPALYLSLNVYSIDSTFITSVTADIFEMDKKCLVVQVQCVDPSYQSVSSACAN